VPRPFSCNGIEVAVIMVR